MGIATLGVVTPRYSVEKHMGIATLGVVIPRYSVEKHTGIATLGVVTPCIVQLILIRDTQIHTGIATLGIATPYIVQRYTWALRPWALRPRPTPADLWLAKLLQHHGVERMRLQNALPRT